MDIHRLDQIFNPKRIALIGVTTNPKSVGGQIRNNLVGGGFKGVVYPVNPDHEAVIGIHCYPDLSSLPRTPDLAIICTPADKVLKTVDACGAAGIKGIIINSAGFRETGPEGMSVETKILKTAQSYGDMRIIGPNCLGIIVPGLELNASFSAGYA